jgi:hypothetical protein
MQVLVKWSEIIVRTLKLSSPFWISCHQVTLQVFQVPEKLTPLDYLKQTSPGLDQVLDVSSVVVDVDVFIVFFFSLFKEIFKSVTEFILFPKGREKN